VPESDRDLLIAVKTKVDAIHRDMVEPGGRVPKLEETVDDHSKSINTFAGSFKTIVWVLGGLGLLFVGLSGVVLAHVLGGK
jgi:hypothetical protein